MFIFSLIQISNHIIKCQACFGFTGVCIVFGTVGASSMCAWQFVKSQFVAEKNHWTKFISMQNQQNLLHREEEREINAFCRDNGVATTPYAPLAAGRLSRDWQANTLRAETDQIAKAKFDCTFEQDKAIAERVKTLTEQKGVSRSAVALAWLLQKRPVAAPIISGSQTQYIDEAIQAFEVELTAEEVAYLEELYQPHELIGVVKDPNL
ncbi:aldo/keto reductase [Pasteurella multocida]|uniref:aldo/keto reductase n=1 Tax=Pasteurella multocida TaxID=747 RepID=UPI001E5A2FAB|nr:aldo/keto reductase [Pasteurella multocida]